MINSIDQLGNSVTLKDYPQRIVSLVPSQTEYLFHLGLKERIVGITNYCVRPASDICRVGGTKNFNIEKIKQLNPDLIIGNKEENYREGIECLQKHFPVWMSDVNNLQDACHMMLEIGRVCGMAEAAQQTVSTITNEFKNYTSRLPVYRPRCAYLIWRKPYMVAGAGTFIDDMIQHFGCQNVFEHVQRYPEIDPNTFQQLHPDYIFLSSEPYRFTEKHYAEFLSFSPKSKVVLVNGEMFSWYGSTLLKTPNYFKDLQIELAQMQ